MSKKQKNTELKQAHIVQPSTELGNDDKVRPLFCFNIISSQYSNDSKLNLVKNEAIHSKELLEKINTLSQLTWGAIKNISRKTNGYEMIPINSLKNSRLKEILKSFNQKEIMVFRVKSNNKSRLLGFREGRVFNICCYDHNGVLYEHE